MAGKELGFLRIARMFKSQLQELCQKKRWGLPRYSAMSDGPDHNPRFKASVSIDGLSFHSPPSCNSFKQAQNEAAQIAFRHFTSPSPRPEGSEVPSNEHEGEGEAPMSSAEGITSSSSVGSKRARSELVLNKVRVYGSVPDIEFARGITVMPFGDDRWVAVCLELPDQLT